MLKYIKRAGKKAGQAPGTLVHIGEQKVEQTAVDVLDYDADRLLEKKSIPVEDCHAFRDTQAVTWINVSGIHDTALIERLGRQHNLHPLVLEDIVHTGQRPKIEDHGDYVYIVLTMLYFDERGREIKAEQVSIVLTKTVVLSFQEAPEDVFNPIRNRIRTAKGRIRRMGADYLCYALLDAVVDEYFLMLEKVAEKIELLQEELMNTPDSGTLKAVHGLRQEMIFLRKSVWPLREVISNLERGEQALISESTRIYFRDVYDHTVQVIETAETFRDVIAGMLDMYLSSVSNRMNEVMKVLTVIATIFIPLTFIAGIYGMNFTYMPELKWRWGYPAVWGVIVCCALGMVVYFKKKKWL
jgi:magnesium transporter